VLTSSEGEGPAMPLVTQPTRHRAARSTPNLAMRNLLLFCFSSASLFPFQMLYRAFSAALCTLPVRRKGCPLRGSLAGGASSCACSSACFQSLLYLTTVSRAFRIKRAFLRGTGWELCG